MTSLPLLLLLILCGFLHACTPRPIAGQHTAKYNFNKELDNVKLLGTLTTLSVKEHKLEENPSQQQKITNNEINIGVSCNSASTLKKVILGSSLQTDSPSLLAEKDERGHARSMLGHHVEETMDTNTNENTEDIVDMDYAQPHRKAPIHNEKP
ncbi:hypothetical protein L195_g003147 [Trifolium pratense]|uniref:Uncharacterized protein n=2 Tax=Trifolium pratense TaxID=57577 RepID=A0A2K3NUI0_TRIPR|nr:uncharacterized protein LOC123908729 [Trifolium pratense]PNY06672.1 hypothetical protein L195_g003147 [Trifolium pratense]CAJ2650501.1 unnamed protein product [Trifolium pratense]